MKLKKRICQEKARHTAYINKFDTVRSFFISSQRVLIIKPKPFPSHIYSYNGLVTYKTATKSAVYKIKPRKI